MCYRQQATPLKSQLIVAESGVQNIDSAITPTEVARYNTRGERVSEPVSGINIVKYSDDSARKELRQ